MVVRQSGPRWIRPCVHTAVDRFEKCASHLQDILRNDKDRWEIWVHSFLQKDQSTCRGLLFAAAALLLPLGSGSCTRVSPNPRAHASLGGGGLACSASDLSVGPHEESDPRPLGVRRDPGPSVGTRSRHVPQHHLQGTKRRAVAVEWGGWGWWGLSDSRRVAWSRGHLLFADTLSMVVCACAANSGPPTFTTRTL